jgi:hypothetical protein
MIVPDSSQNTAPNPQIPPSSELHHNSLSPTLVVAYPTGFSSDFPSSASGYWKPIYWLDNNYSISASLLQWSFEQVRPYLQFF